MSSRRTAGWCVRTNPFVLTPVYKEVARGCVVNLSTTQLQQRRGHKRVLSFGSVLSPCLFYKLTLEGAIVAHSAPTLRSLDREENTKLGDGMETKHLEDQNCTFLSVRKKTDKIFVNIKFLVYFMFCFLFLFWSEWMICLFCDDKRQQVQFVMRRKKWTFEVSNEFILTTDQFCLCFFNIYFIFVITLIVIMWPSCSRKVAVAEVISTEAPSQQRASHAVY